MSRPVAVLAHEEAGRAQLETLGLRVSETNADDPAASRVGSLVQQPFAVGATTVGGLELETAVETRGSSASVHLRVCNRGERAVRLDAAVLSLRWTRHGLSSLRYLRHGWQSWSFTGARDLDAEGPAAFPSGPWLRGFHHAAGDVPDERAGWHESELVGVIGGADGEPALLVGVYERGVSFGIVYARQTAGEVEVAVELRAETLLAPGESLVLETLRLELGRDPTALLEAYALEYGRRVGARVSRPFVAGWCSWYHVFQHVCEADVLRNLEALVAARDELPVEVVQLDDGYQRAVGDWLETNARFPRGLAPLAEEIRAAGFTPGLWTAPFCVVPESALFAKQPGWLLQDANGAQPFRAMLHPDWSRDAVVHALDASRPEVVAHLESLFRELVSLGFRYLKLDFLFVQALACVAAEPGRSRVSRLRQGLEAIRAGAGEEAFLLGCGCPLGAAVGVVDGMRVGPDVAPHWLPDPATRIPGIEETQPSTRSAIRSVLSRGWMHRRLWLNDPDCLMVRSEDTELASGEREALATAIAATGGMCVFSDDLPGLTRSDRALLRASLESAARVDGAGIPGAARVKDLLAQEIPSEVVTQEGASRFQGFVNASEGEREFETHARHAEIGSAAAGDRLSLAARCGALLREEREVPLAVFCDFDGTFSVQDVGATLAQRFAPERRPAAWERYERGELTPWTYNMEILEGLPVDHEALESFLRSVELDPGARALLAWCGEAGVPFRVLSDGFDWNLNRLQVIHQVRFAYQANRLRLEEGRWRIRPGAPNPACGCGTGTCKSGVIGAYRAEHPEARLVHIGNGRVSDTCGALAADEAFAKDSLAPELERRGAPFHRFETLLDVIPVLEGLLPTP